MKKLLNLLFLIPLFCLYSCGESKKIEKDYSSVDCPDYMDGWYEDGYVQGNLSKKDFDDKTSRDCQNGIETWNKLRVGRGWERMDVQNSSNLPYRDCFCKGFYEGYDNN